MKAGWCRKTNGKKGIPALGFPLARFFPLSVTSRNTPARASVRLGRMLLEICFYISRSILAPGHPFPEPFPLHLVIFSQSIQLVH